MSKYKNLAAGRRIGGFASIGMALIAIAPASIFASPIPITGNGDLIKGNQAGSLLAVSSNTPCIAFSGSAPACAGTATAFSVSGGDPIFKVGNTGSIKDIASTPLTAFETVQLTTGGPAIFDLLNIIAPLGLPACNTSTTSGACTTGTFSFLQQTPTQVVISLALNELGYVGTNAGATSYLGVFSTTLSGNLNSFGCVGFSNCTDTIGNILAWEAGAGHSLSSSWSATESPVSGVPEPMTLSMMGVGLLGLGLISRRRKQS